MGAWPRFDRVVENILTLTDDPDSNLGPDPLGNVRPSNAVVCAAARPWFRCVVIGLGLLSRESGREGREGTTRCAAVVSHLREMIDRFPLQFVM